MKIIIDAMGGDHAPAEFLKGAFAAAKECKVDILLVGRVEQLLQLMNELGIQTLPEGVELMNAEDVVDMHDDPATVVRTRKNSSMVTGLKLLADGGGDAFISAGSTGALLSAATLVVKRVRGVRRAAFSPVIPTKGAPMVLIDAGANAECSPEFLLQFGCMGSFYARRALGVAQPRVGLLNNGAEDSKGDELHKQAYALLKAADERGTIRFVGNVEARDAMLGAADVLVADGFSGNVMLKSIEGTGIYMASLLKKTFKRNVFTKLGALLCKKGIREIRETLNYKKTGGTILLGITKPVIKAHGSSDAEAVVGAVRQAIEAVNSGICGQIKEHVAEMTLPRETEHA